MLTTIPGLPAAASLQQAILLAQLKILRQLEAQRHPRSPGRS
jgi:hypothetical protein